ncbi:MULTISPECIES: RNA-binding S4 domain-containing protein [Limibacillus]|jgi:ribosome-associated heat shock protein Hsp15|uniref:Ribosome-associated heat shock protein Hsp15 n=1 Tax=Limibacillus halophilus TaxID=1579333 RepID=A0A839SRJ4_9PROT|nr:RNA-binding S4 domain-containing protein [Limibacillus halophilus]MBB3063976.1 ribosome-associated heat shock protein Hsp15 [Limibacillus halophilus]
MTIQSQRLDKWLWGARFFKTRSLATKQCHAGGMRVDGTLTLKAHHLLRGGEVLTFRQGDHIRVIRVLALAERRGPASEAQMLYEDLSPPETQTRLPADRALASGARDRGSGRPTKKDRRQISKLKEDL